jgi:predicted nucleic acid-binding protein
MARLISTTIRLDEEDVRRRHGWTAAGAGADINGTPSFPEYEAVLTPATVVIVPGLVLAEVDNLGLVDGTVAAVAERRKVYRVLTTDRRHFSAIRLGPRLSQAFAVLP